MPILNDFNHYYVNKITFLQDRVRSSNLPLRRTKNNTLLTVIELSHSIKKKFTPFVVAVDKKYFSKTNLLIHF